MADSSGIATMELEYDDLGRLVAWRTFDISGDPKGRREDNVAAGRYAYRAFDGVLVSQELFDATGKPVPSPR